MKSFKTHINESTDLDEMDISVKSIKKSGLSNVRKAGKVDKLKSDIAAMRKRLDGDKEKKPLKAAYEEVELDEAPRKKAPKMTGDSIAIQRAKDAEHNKAMGRTKTGRKKPVRQMTSTQRSLAQLRGEEVELDENAINDLTAQYINENNITLDQLENMTEEELNELVNKATSANKMSASDRADAAEKKADAVEKRNKDRQRIKNAKQRVRDAQRAART